MTDERINLIFDCDGTLVDSYPAILDAVGRVLKRHGIDRDPAELRDRALHSSVIGCLTDIVPAYGLDPDAVYQEFRAEKQDLGLIPLYPHARELLQDPRFRCFVYTHRGVSARIIFSGLGVDSCLEEIVDSTYGFQRKPDPQGVDYLVEKYALDKKRTYYVGDRVLDLECGRNAGVGTIFFDSSGLDLDTSGADHIVSDLGDIAGLPFK